MRSVFNNIWLRVVKISSVTMDTDATMRINRIIPEPTPCLVIETVWVDMVNVAIASPGDTVLKIAVIIIYNDKNGLN